MAMRRSMLGATVGLAAIALGAVSFWRGQFWLGVCFCLLGVLRLGSVWWARKPKQPEAEIRLNLEDSPPQTPREDPQKGR